MKLTGNLKQDLDEFKPLRKQQYSELDGVRVKNLILDPHFQYMGPKLKNNVRIPYKNSKPLKPKTRKDLQSVLPDLPPHYKKDLTEKMTDNLTEKRKKNSQKCYNFSQNNKRKTYLLNEIIQILQNKQTIHESELRQQQRFKKCIRTQPDYVNEFVELNPVTLKNSRGPRLIQNNITKLHLNVPQRRMFSEEKNRVREGDSNHKGQFLRRKQSGGQLVTFYRPKVFQHKKYQEDKNEFLELQQQ